MMNIEDAKRIVETSKARSAWRKGVTLYALDFLDNLNEYITCGDIKEIPTNHEELKKVLLNGAVTWEEYSYNGCSLIYDYDICERLCNSTEKKLTRGGERQPSKRETWLDVQTRALTQAYLIIERTLC